MVTCLVGSCDSGAIRAGLCWSHYFRKRRYGDPLGAPHDPSDAERLWSQVIFTDHGGIWVGATNGPYGRLYNQRGERIYAHRLAWELMRGPLDSYQILDHDAGCPKTCVTPGHLTIRESNAEHTTAGWAKGEYSENWVTRPKVPQDPKTGRFVGGKR